MDLSSPGKKYRVLVADAEPAARRGLMSIIGAHEMLEVCGETGCLRSARDLCEQLLPDVLVLDPSLADGFVLIKDLPRWSPTTRVVAFTGLADAVSVQRALQAGAFGYVTRRDPLESVILSILAAADGRRQMGPLVERLFWETIATGQVDLRGEGLRCLSDRELQIFRLMGRGLITREVAKELRLSVKTVETYRGRMKEKLGVRNGHDLQRRAVMFAGVDSSFLVTAFVENEPAHRSAGMVLDD